MVTQADDAAGLRAGDWEAVGHTLERRWLDFDERYRNLRDVAVLAPHVYS